MIREMRTEVQAKLCGPIASITGISGPSFGFAHRRGHVLGASILGAHAGELAHLWVVAIDQKLKLRDLAQMIAPYPTWGELDKTAASEFSSPLPANSLTRGLVRVLSCLP